MSHKVQRKIARTSPFAKALLAADRRGHRVNADEMKGLELDQTVQWRLTDVESGRTEEILTLEAVKSDHNDLESIAIDVEIAMKKNGLFWLERPTTVKVAYVGGPGGAIDVYQARIGSEQNSDDTNFIGPTEDLLGFWRTTLHLVSDWDLGDGGI